MQLQPGNVHFNFAACPEGQRTRSANDIVGAWPIGRTRTETHTRKEMTMTTKDTIGTQSQPHELSASEIQQVSGGIAWFPIIMAVARFAFSQAKH